MSAVEVGQTVIDSTVVANNQLIGYVDNAVRRVQSNKCLLHQLESVQWPIALAGTVPTCSRLSLMESWNRSGLSLLQRCTTM